MCVCVRVWLDCTKSGLHHSQVNRLATHTQLWVFCSAPKYPHTIVVWIGRGFYFVARFLQHIYTYICVLAWGLAGYQPSQLPQRFGISTPCDPWAWLKAVWFTADFRNVFGCRGARNARKCASTFFNFYVLCICYELGVCVCKCVCAWVRRGVRGFCFTPTFALLLSAYLCFNLLSLYLRLALWNEELL